MVNGFTGAELEFDTGAKWRVSGRQARWFRGLLGGRRARYSISQSKSSALFPMTDKVKPQQVPLLRFKS
jgi:hypothetical protein